MENQYGALRRMNQNLYTKGREFQGNMPIHFRVSLLESCNLRCYMCHLSALPEEQLDELSKEVMEEDVFYSMAKDAFPFAEKVTFGFAGEPTIHPKFPQFLQYAREFGITTEVWTNGTLLYKPKVAQAIADYADWLVVSMDGADEEMFAHTRDGASLATVSDSIQTIRELAEKSSVRTRMLYLGAHNTMNQANVHQLPLLVEKACEIGLHRVSSAHMGTFDGNLKDESLFMDMDRSDQYIIEAVDRAKQLQIDYDFPPEFSKSNYAQPNSDFHCHQTNYSCIVMCDGNVIPCCHAASRFRLVMGNLKEEPFHNIWYGRRYGILRESFAEKDLSPSCRECANNDPFMDVSTVWDFDTFSQRAIAYQDRFLYIPPMDEYQHFLTKQKDDLLTHAYYLKETAENKLNEIREYEKTVWAKYRNADSFSSHLQNASWFTRLDKHSHIQSNTIRKANRMLCESGPGYQGNMPVHLEVSVIAGCNIKCKMCNLAHISDDEYKQLMDRQMTMDVYQKIVDEAYPYAESVFFGIGGEPTLHPHFTEMVRQAAEAGVSVRFTTNGLKLRSKELAQLCVDHVDTIVISMDGATKNTFEEIRVGANWDRLIESIETITALRSQSPNSKLKLAVNYTLMKSNIEEFPKMVQLAHGLGIEKVMAEHLLVTHDSLKDESLFNYRKRSDELINIALQEAKALGVTMEIPDLFDMNQVSVESEDGSVRNIRPVEREQDSLHCSALGYSVVIMPSGHIMPCGHPQAEFQLRMGDLNEQSFTEVWYGGIYQQLRVQEEKHLPMPCANCAMCGRSDGDIPTQELTCKEACNTHDSNQSVSRDYISRKLMFMGDLLDEAEQLHEHNQQIEHLIQQMDQHVENINQIKAAHPTWHKMQRKARTVSRRSIHLLNKLRLSQSNTNGKEQFKPSKWNASLDWITQPPQVVKSNQNLSFTIMVENIGEEIWHDGNREDNHSVMLGGRIFQNETFVGYLNGWGNLPKPLHPGDLSEIHIQTNTNEFSAGTYELKMDMVQLGNDFFETFGSTPLSHSFQIAEQNETEAYWDKALRSCSNLWTVSQGIHKHGDHTFPLFASQANGSHLYDLDGNQFLDYIMGWGTSTLGYNRPEIQEAILPWLGNGPTLPFPHPLQVETAEMLQQFLPCADRIVFGKNASDVLEAAVRTARAYTNRDHVLCCGYHGFHDWYVASVPSVKGVPNALRELIHPFHYGDIQSFEALIDEWGDQTACVVIEPCSMAYPPEGYLQAVREITQKHNIVLIFDEVMSAFRLANGGAQEVYKIEPDMVVVGKGIANGMPLAALGGVTPLIDSIFEVGYGPTFHSEIYSLAAAKAALEIYNNEPVCHSLNQMGEQLHLGITSAASEWDIPVNLEGIFPRQVFMFKAKGEYTASHLRTYFLQELMKHKIVCGGTLLPSMAHTQEQISYTIESIHKIFADMNQKLKQSDLENHIQIPLNELYLGEKEKVKN